MTEFVDLMLWRNDGTKIVEVSKKSLPSQNVTEMTVEEWIKSNPSFLHEDMVIIAQQHSFPSGEKADLIGVDEDGALVIIEIKRKDTGGRVDFQFLKYVSYVSGWTYNEVEEIAKKFYSDNENMLEEEFHSLSTLLEESFGEDFSVENLNKFQRIIVVGQNIDVRIGSVLVWLSEQKVGIKAVEFEPYKIENTTYLYTKVVIPLVPYEKYVDARRYSEGTKPWIQNGEKWHCEEKMGKVANELFNQLDQVIQSMFPGINGPNWGQEFYISYKVHGYRWLVINTRKNQLNLTFNFAAGNIKSEDVSTQLGIVSEDISLQEKSRKHRLKLKVREKYSFDSPEFQKFLKICYASFSSLY